MGKDNHYFSGGSEGTLQVNEHAIRQNTSWGREIDQYTTVRRNLKVKG